MKDATFKPGKTSPIHLIGPETVKEQPLLEKIFDCGVSLWKRLHGGEKTEDLKNVHSFTSPIFHT